MRVIVHDDDQEEIFVCECSRGRPGEAVVLCPTDKKRTVIVGLVDAVRTLCDTQFPIE